MNLERLGRSNNVKVTVGVLVLIAVASGAYLAFGDEEPVEISNAEELQQVRGDLDGHYVLVDDIDLSHIKNFTPIGGYDDGFTGTLDGNGYTISNLTIDRPDGANVGLFFGMDGTIENLILRDVEVTGGEAVGGLAGVSTGTVTESRVTGEVNGNQRVGGLVGVAWAGEIRDSRSEAKVTGNLLVGGFVGQNDGGNITRSSAAGSVSGGTGVGGLVGDNQQVVDKSYAGGDVTGNTSGGLVGINENEIRNSYATANVTGIAGGLVGVNTGEVANSYWDINTTVQANSVAGTGLTTSEMTASAARENIKGFDFEEMWRTTEDDYPRLAWQSETDDKLEVEK